MRTRKPRHRKSEPTLEVFPVMPVKPILVPLEGTIEAQVDGAPFRVDTRSQQGQCAQTQLCALFSDITNRPPGLDRTVSGEEAATRFCSSIESALEQARTPSSVPDVLYCTVPHGITLVIATVSRLATIPRATWH